MIPAPTLVLRPASAEDADAIRGLVRAAYARWVPVIGREPMPMIADYDRAVREHDFELAYLGPELAGLIETMSRDDHLWIENVAVSPPQQGKGLGRRLLARAESKAVATGHRELRLLTNAAFAANVTLYQKVGYVIDRSEPFMGGTTLYMSKTLLA